MLDDTPEHGQSRRSNEPAGFDCFVLTGSWRDVWPRARRGAGLPTSEWRPGKRAACLCGCIATDWWCRPSLKRQTNKWIIRMGFKRKAVSIYNVNDLHQFFMLKVTKRTIQMSNTVYIARLRVTAAVQSETHASLQMQRFLLIIFRPGKKNKKKTGSYS